MHFAANLYNIPLFWDWMLVRSLYLVIWWHAGFEMSCGPSLSMSLFFVCFNMMCAVSDIAYCRLLSHILSCYICTGSLRLGLNSMSYLLTAYRRKLYWRLVIDNSSMLWLPFLSLTWYIFLHLLWIPEASFWVAEEIRCWTETWDLSLGCLLCKYF